MEYAGARVPEMAKCRLCVAMPPQSPSCLHGQTTCEGDVGHLANLAHRRRQPQGTQS